MADEALKLKRLIIAALRKVWLYSKARGEARRAAKIAKEDKYKCAACAASFERKLTAVDHIVPIGSFKDWNTYIASLFCPTSNLQVLCKPCHKEKTNKEGIERRASAKKPK